MGALCKLIDFVLFFSFAVIAVFAPLIDFQVCLPVDIYPAILVDLKQWYSSEYGDYLYVEKPNFFIGLIWHELLFVWPLSIGNIYAILAGKSWFGTTSLLSGASIVATVAAILGELLGSGKASDKLIMMYAPFLGIGILAIIRGLVSPSTKSSGGVSKKPANLARRKRA